VDQQASLVPVASVVAVIRESSLLPLLVANHYQVIDRSPPDRQSLYSIFLI